MTSKVSFLYDFAEFIISKFGKKNLRQELKIILSNSYSCSELKEVLTNHYNVQNLPIIIPFSAILKDSSDYISKMEELFTLSNIITEYKKLAFTPEEALKAAGILNKLFADLVNNNIDIKLIETYNNSEYWQNIYKFLEFSFFKWQENEKQSSNNDKLKLLWEEIVRTKNSHKQVILAGIFKPDTFLTKYEKELQIIKYNEIKLVHNNIYYYEPANIYEEAEQIAYTCTQNVDKKIAIVINNNKLKRVYCNYLEKYGLMFKDLIGNNLKLTNVSSLLISIINILCNNFDLKLLFLLLKNPLINCTIIQELELFLLNKNRFISSPRYLLQLQFDNKEVKNYCHNLVDILFATKPYNIKDILVLSKEIAEKILPEIWEQERGAKLLEFFNNLTEFSGSINVDKKKFPKIFALLLSNVKYYKNVEYASIVIGSPEELALSRFDLVILPHFNSDNWSAITTTNNPYLSKEAKQILDIDYDEINPQIYSDYFNLLLQNEEVIILNAKKYAGKLSTPCNLFLKLSNTDIIPWTRYRIKKNIAKDLVHKPQDDLAHSNFFPNMLSVTDIETLIRNPYNFYAKKILKLRTQDKIWEEHKISDFGNFIHKVLEKYSKNYNQQNMLDRQQALLNIGNNILHSSILPIYTKKTWQTKLTLLSKAFVLFDMERRKNCSNIYFETIGELNLNIAGQNIKIIGIADRIEISKSNHITILDYKTGTVPTKKEIEQGLSPQLIIESLMILENGFNICLSHSSLCRSREGEKPVEEITIAYVKITSTEPYVQTTEMSLHKEELDKHKQGLTRLLEYYVTNKSFVYDLDLSKYNDYLHLRR